MHLTGKTFSRMPGCLIVICRELAGSPMGPTQSYTRCRDFQISVYGFPFSSVCAIRRLRSDKDPSAIHPNGQSQAQRPMQSENVARSAREHSLEICVLSSLLFAKHIGLVVPLTCSPTAGFRAELQAHVRGYIPC